MLVQNATGGYISFGVGHNSPDGDFGIITVTDPAAWHLTPTTSTST